MDLLEFKRVSKRYGDGGAIFSTRAATKREGKLAVRDVSFRIRTGERLGIVGKSGAGKSTIVRLAAGLETPTSGEILLDAENHPGGWLAARRVRRARSRILQVVWQDAFGSLNPHMKAADIVAEPLRIHRTLSDRKELLRKVEELIEEVGLPRAIIRRRPHELSGGEAQRVGIARALALDPGLLVCDEPGSALDVRTKLRLIELLRRLNRDRSMALLVIAHDLPVVRALTEDLLVLDEGFVVETGATQKLLTSPAHVRTRSLVEAEPALI